MSRRSAIVLLVMVAMWTAAPAFACWMPAQHHACCRQMAQDCPATMGADSSCCQVHSPRTDFPRAGDPGADRLVQFAPDANCAGLEIPVVFHTATLPTAKAPPPLTLSSRSILRI